MQRHRDRPHVLHGSTRSQTSRRPSDHARTTIWGKSYRCQVSGQTATFRPLSLHKDGFGSGSTVSHGQGFPVVTPDGLDSHRVGPEPQQMRSAELEDPERRRQLDCGRGNALGIDDDPS